jgi:transposase
MEKLNLKPHQIAPQYVKPYVKSQKNDRGDAEAISEAGRCATMNFVPTKSAEQLELQAVQRVRERLIHDRTAIMNQIRGVLAEHGIAIKRGAAALEAELNIIGSRDLSPTMVRLILELRKELEELNNRIKFYGQQLTEQAKSSPIAKRLCTIPGVGVLTALALLVLSGNPKEFKNGRHFAAFLGLVPRQVSTGGKTKLLGITKRGDRVVRALLIHGARSVVRAAVLKQKTDPYSLWIRKLHAKNGTNHTAVAVANKNARVAWRILTSDEEFDAAKLARAENIQ